MNTHNHFDSIADDFNGLWQMTPEYKDWMIKKIIFFLDFLPKDIFVDLGGGTGLYTEYIIEKTHLLNKALCVEPSQQMLSQIKRSDIILPIHADALSFVKQNIVYNKILLKEMIHFVKNRDQLFNGIQKQLAKNGKMLIVTRPKNTPLPFFNAALEAFAKEQPSIELLQQELENLNISYTFSKEHFTFNIPKTRWFEMLRNKFMSNLQNFADEEIKIGIYELEKKFKDVETIDIKDEILFICGEKSKIF